MGRRPGSKNKRNKFEDLPQDFRDVVEASNKEILQEKLATVAKNIELNAAAMKADQDLSEKRAAVVSAASAYAQARKALRLQAEYIIIALSDKGDEFAEQLVRLNLSAVKP